MPRFQIYQGGHNQEPLSGQAVEALLTRMDEIVVRHALRHIVSGTYTVHDARIINGALLERGLQLNASERLAVIGALSSHGYPWTGFSQFSDEVVVLAQAEA